MTRATLLDVLEQLHLHTDQQNTNMYLLHPMDTWLALTLLNLATSTKLCYMAHLFGMGKALIGAGMLHNICEAQEFFHKGWVKEVQWSEDAWQWEHQLQW
ncbi:hypothetical protein Y1Q_0017656 [Alligator mississippiensis]|uniref:Uncharacterized protein n=1 Tax=Alligator mississippiensis TaxID=8496 RepID=A0A151N0Y6_ALLMI|nr:hypothetical protein Y1Q_0017656 [Alligator mississippiensis]